MFWTIFIIAFILVGLSIIGFGISTFFPKKKKFLETHIGRNKAMSERDISCVVTTDRKERQNYKPIDIDKINSRKDK